MTKGPLRIETFTAPGFGQNSYLVLGRTGAVAVDAGGVADEMTRALAAEGRTLDAILLTHAHMDHVEGVAALKRATGALVYLHEGDRPLYDRATGQAAVFGVQIEAPPPPDRGYEHGAVLRFGDVALEVRFAPGHSPGHVVLYSAEADAAFVGDVVFAGSIGRTDLPGGDFRQLMKSIRTQVLTLPDRTVLLSGHGPATSVEHERATNPFLIPHFGGELA